MKFPDSPARIQKLPISLASQIAAGEVIERPASVIKELLENSLDASATSIDIHVEKGGMHLIRVTDNGHGIHPDDIQLALESHATSKLHKESDLQRVTSLGFRGEALSSIASTAQFKLTSRQTGIEQAWTLKFDPVTDNREYYPAAHPIGTTIEVNSLFHAIPARRKFLRSERTEFQHILAVVRRLALSRASVNIELFHNEQRVLRCHEVGDDPQSRVISIMGQPFARDAITLDYTIDHIRLQGWLGSPALSRSQTDRQYFYLNGRMIRDRHVNHAIRLALDNTIPPGRYPSYVLYLEMDTTAVDVNVHPMKYEVRFRDARKIHDFIYACLRDALHQDSLTHSSIVEEYIPDSNITYGVNESKQEDAYKEMSMSRQEIYGKKKPSSFSPKLSPLGQAIAQFKGRFILNERDNNLVLLDISAARKFIAHVRLLSVNKKNPLHSRPLLVPVNIQVSSLQGASVEKHSSTLLIYGLDLNCISSTSVVVRSLPTILQEADINKLIPEILSVLANRSDKCDFHKQITTLIEQYICSNTDNLLSDTEINNLYRSLEDAGLDMREKNYTGIWRSLTIDELETLLLVKK